MRLASLARRPRLIIEPLESRDNPSGTVNATVNGGVLTLTGDDLDNVVEVQQTGSGSFTVSGTNTTIQGGSSFAGVTSISANLADGNDWLTLSTTVDLDVDGAPDFVLPGAVTANLGDGNSIFGLTTFGTIQIGSLAVTAGDGADQVQVAGGVDKGSRIAGNASIAVGIGINSQGPVYQDTLINLSNLEVGGAGGLKVTGEDGTEQVTLTAVKVTRALSVDGGEGNTSVITFGGTMASATLKSAGPGNGYSTTAISLAATGTKVAGPVSLKSPTGSSLTLDSAELGPVTMAGGKAGFYGASVETTAGASTVHGDLKLTGGRISVVTRGDATGASSLAVDGAFSATGNVVDLNMAQGSSVTAGTLSFSGARSSQFYSYNPDAATPGKVTVAGAMTFKGQLVDFSQYGGEVQVGGKLTLQATKKATFTSAVYGSGFLFNAPRARTVAGSILVQGREVEFHQTESDVTAATGFSLVGKETALFDAFPREQVEDPANPGTYDPAIGATTTVANGTLLMSAPESAEYYQTDGVLTLGGGLKILSPGGSASYRTDVGDGFDAPGPRLTIPTANVLIQGHTADFQFEGGMATVGGTVSVRGKEGAGFSTDFGETHDVNWNFTDLYPTVTTGTVTVNGGVDAANFSTFGETFTAHGDVIVKGTAGLSRTYFQDRTGSQVDGDVTVSAGSDYDAFLAWGPLSIGGNLSVDLGSGSNDFETGIYGGTTRVNGNLTFKSGNGSDTFELGRLEVAGTTLITTGAGSDQVYLLGGTKFTGTVTLDTGGGADLVSVATAWPDPNNPGGPPAFAAGAVEFDAKATIKLGSGNDKLVLGDATDPAGVVNFGANGSLSGDGGLSLGDTFIAIAGRVDLSQVTTVEFEL
jgi:hypothetical protein